MTQVNYRGEYKGEIKEFKAPTDESIKILNDFQAKAMENLIAKVVLDNNLVEGVGMLFKDPTMDLYTLKTRFIINGKEFNFSKELDRNFRRLVIMGGGDCEEFIKENMFTYFADELIKEFWKNEKEVTKELNNMKYGSR